MVSVAFAACPPYEAVIVAVVCALVPGAAVTVNVALMAPAGIVTLAGALAADGLLFESDTTAPPVGAVPDNVTVACDGLPPLTLTGLTVIEVRLLAAVLAAVWSA